MPKIEMKPIAAETEKFVRVTQQREDAARAGDGDVDEHDERVEPVLHRRVDEERDEQQRERDDERRGGPSASFSSLISPAHSRCVS